MSSSGGEAAKTLLRNKRRGRKDRRSLMRSCKFYRYGVFYLLIADMLIALRKLVGGTPAAGASKISPEELAMELQTFDMKVYRAQTQMMKEFSSKLKSLGVPFFGTKVELVNLAKKDGTDEDRSKEPKDGKGMIDELELLKFQKKMITLLEDLCSD